VKGRKKMNKAAATSHRTEKEKSLRKRIDAVKIGDLLY